MDELASPQPREPHAPDRAEKPRDFSFVHSLDTLPPGGRVVAVPAPGCAEEYEPIGLFGDGGGRLASVRVWGMVPVVGGGHIGQFLGTLKLAGAKTSSERMEAALVDGCVGMGFGSIVLDLGCGAVAVAAAGARVA